MQNFFTTNICSALSEDPAAQAGLQLSQSKSTDTSNRWSLDDSGLLRLDDRIYVPAVKDLRLQVLHHHHDHILIGHFGQNRTLELIRQNYTWPGIRTFVCDYVKSCTTCARNKHCRHKPYGLLKPLPVPERPWDSISMDFIEELPDAHGYNAILVIIDRASKQGIFISCDTHITSEELAKIFVIHVFSKHGVPHHVTSDRGSEFVSRFMHALGVALDMKLHFTAGYHSEADGQTERANQTLEQYIRTYCAYQQDDWDEWLPLAEFAYNNAPNASPGLTPFFANKGYHPNITVFPKRDLASARAREFAIDLDGLHEFLRVQMSEAQVAFKKQADKHHIASPPFNVGDKAYV